VGAAIVKPKRKCCTDDPRCKRCPVVLKRLEKAGLAQRKGKGYRLSKDLKKKHLAALRSRA
jgi:hypothetical protein